jgi:AraC family transcriptional regulator, transcriptional activator of pobA
MIQRDIPNYHVYGEPIRPLDVGFMHVELVSTRNNLHRGEVAAHKHPDMAQITYWTKGGGTYHIDEKTWHFAAPAISFVPCNTVHGFSVSATSDAIVVSIANDALAAISRDATVPVFLNSGLAAKKWPTLAALMTLLMQEYLAIADFKDTTMSHLVGVVLALIARHHAATRNAPSKYLHPLAERLRQRIDAAFRDNLTIHQYADELHTTYHLLDKAAHHAFSKPVKQLIQDRRLLEAKRLLKFTIRSAEDIANELGFTDPAYFSRAFKKHTGLAPGAWRTSQLYR